MNSFSGTIKAIEAKRETMEIAKYGHILSDSERDLAYIAEIEEDKERRKKAKIAAMVQSFVDTIPPRFSNATFDTFLCETEKQKAVIAYLKEGKSAIIYGSNGTGKTHLAYASCRYQIERGRTSCYVMAFDFFNKIRRSFSDSSTELIMNKYKDFDYLVIDEIDKTQGTPTEYVYLYSLINERYNYLRSTVLITNTSAGELCEIVGKSSIDRVASEGKVIELVGDNYRQRKNISK